MDLFQSFVEKICLCVSVTYLFTVSSEKRAMSLVDIFFIIFEVYCLQQQSCFVFFELQF